MSSPIQGLGQVRSVISPELQINQPDSGATEGVDFSGMLMDSLSQVNNLQNQAQLSIGQSVSGEDISQVEVMSAVKKADLSMRMLLQVRNKLLEALSEIKQMQM